MGFIRERNSALSLLVPGDLETRTGGYIYDRRIVEGLRELGWEVDVHSLDRSFPLPSPDALREAAAVLRSISSGRLVVIDSLALAGLSKALEAEANRLRLVALIHHPLSLETSFDEITARQLAQSERNALMRVRHVIVTGAWTSRKLSEYGVTSERISIVEPGTDIHTTFRPDRSVSQLNLLCVATLTERKGHAILFDALAKLRTRSWHLRCVGSDTRESRTAEALRRQVDALQLADRITFVGEVDDAAIQQEYARCDVFVLASLLEGYGMALAEAIAHGVPIVATTAGAIPETVPPDCSLLVPPGDVEALAEALTVVLESPERRAQLAAGAAAAARSLPTWKVTSQRFADVLNLIAGTML